MFIHTFANCSTVLISKYFLNLEQENSGATDIKVCGLYRHGLTHGLTF